MKYFVLFILFSPWCFGAEYILDRTNKAGIRKVDILKKEKGVYYFDGKDLGKKLPPKIQTAWRSIEKGPQKAGKTNCFAGSYVFIRQDKGQEFRQRGCAEGAAYGHFIQNIEDVRSHAQGL